MNFTKTCHHALSAVVRSTRQLGYHKMSEAEDVFFTTAHQRLEESARMLSAMRGAALAETADASGKPAPHVLLNLHEHRRVTSTTQHVQLQGQESQDVTHAA